MPGLWRNQDGTKEGKYLVQRRDGSVPDWPYFVLGARDPAAPMALRTYANVCEALGLDAAYVRDVRRLATDFEAFLAGHGSGDPDAARHRTDDPAIVAKMAVAKDAGGGSA
ncbi:MAG: hypothetical protein ACYCZN_01285 [Candidatus Dormibacteria bacterium]